MLILGLLSIIQIIFLPGFLILKLVNIKYEGSLQAFLYTFGLSLSFNYYLVCALVFLKIYFPITIFIIFLLELLIIALLIVRGRLKIPINKNINEYNFTFIGYLKSLTGAHRVLFLFAVSTILFFSSLIIFNASTTYYFVDTTIMKFWIQTWSSNQFMVYSHYPQLMSTNFSINYLFTNSTSVDFFTKALMPLFFIGILLIFLDLSRKERPLIHLTGFILYSYILLVFYGILFISDFNNDIPVSFFGFLSFYVILKQKKNSFDLQTVLLVAFFSVSAANTKLVGLYAVGLSVLWILHYFYTNKDRVPQKEILKSIRYLVLIYLVGLFWYFIFPLLMSGGIGASRYKPFDDLIESFIYGVQLISVNFGKLFSVLMLALLIAALFTRVKMIVLFVIAPLFFLWAFWYSYDCRNLSLIIPFATYSSGYGLGFIYNEIRKRKNISFSNRNNNQRLIPEMVGKKPLLSLSVIAFLISIFLIVNSGAFFNFGMKTAYLFRSFYFNYNILVYTNELGYYRYVEYFINTLSVLTILTLIIFLIRKSKIRILHLIVIIFAGIVILNFTMLRSNDILGSQRADEEKVKMHNLYFQIHSFLNNGDAVVMTNSPSFGELIFPEGIKINFNSKINQDTINYYLGGNEARYIMFEIDRADHNQEPDFDFIKKTYTTYLRDNNFIFFGLPYINR